MKRVTAIFYTFEEFDDLLRRCCFTHGEDFEVEIIDTFFWRINYYPTNMDVGDDGLHLSDFDALPGISKMVGIKLANTHVTHDGIWLEGEEALPRRTRKS